MVAISHPVRRSVVTNIPGSVDATLTGDGGTPIADADVVGGLGTKTIAFAAGETLQYATWNLVDDAALEGAEGYKVTLSNPQPSGTLSVPSITGTVQDNDGTTPPPSGVLYDDTANDSGFHDLGADGGTIDFVVNDVEWKIWFISDTDGTPGAYVRAPFNGKYEGKYNSATQSDQLIDANWNFQDAGGNFVNTPARVVLTASTFKLYIGDMTTPKKNEDFLQYIRDKAGSTFNGVRFETAGAAVPIKITKA